ncbi:MAG: ABC transporter ATP-binding protein [Sulfobacillus thermosulfidooxidans]|nr:MAG: ABC transporter ATP-binding protein [Sulfobacillus thermosulfidooxidans]
MASNPILSADNLVKRYAGKSRVDGAVTAVNHVSFALRQGEVTALIGESGSGKTTIARILTGLEKPTSGAVVWENHAPLSRKALQQRVQMVFQDPFAALNPMNSVGYTVSRPLINYRHMARSQISGEVTRLLEAVQLTPGSAYIYKRPFELSGGQRQRVVIARALAAAPQVIVADEPVSMLDVSIRSEILRLLRAVLEHQGVQSMLYITHDLLSAQLIADQVLVLYRGHIVERGPTQEILQNPLHPYTQLLMDSIPNPWRRKESRPRVAQTMSSKASEGCPFAPLCPLVMEPCWSRPAPNVERPSGGHVACFAVQDGRTQQARDQ